MKCLIFSDSHGKLHYMQRALNMHPDAEVVFFLGDGLSDADVVRAMDTRRMWIAVSGNCDFYTLFNDRFPEKVDEITLASRKIVITHGDLYDAKWGEDKLIYLAKERDADVILYGHTHRPLSKYLDADEISREKPLYLFNPGSISSEGRSFGILTLTDNSVLFSHGSFL